ncbi:MAG: hypothetical protein WBM29_07130 [Candidatus Deferrimicrobium sp.]
MFLSLLGTLHRIGSSTNKDARDTDKGAYMMVDEEQGSAQLNRKPQKVARGSFLEKQVFSTMGVLIFQF